MNCKQKILLSLSILPIFAFGQVNNISTVAGNGAITDTGDGGLAVEAALNYPGYVAFDNSGNYYIADCYSNRIRKVNSLGVISGFAGNGVSGYSGEGGPATSAAIFNPTGIAVDKHGNVFVADAGNNRIRKIDNFGTITTIAGIGSAGYNGDNISATTAQLNSPYSVALDTSGSIYIADYGNHRIRKIASGIITTIAGTGINGYDGDGGAASSSRINFPMDLTVDKVGVVFFADYGNHRVRKISPSGAIETVAGNGLSGFYGENILATNAELWFPSGVCLDKQGSVLFVDQENQRVRKVNTSGMISTLAGNGHKGFAGDGGDALLAEFHLPTSVALDDANNVYIADKGNMRIRKIAVPSTIKQFNISMPDIVLHPNPATETLTITAGVEIETVAILNAVGQVVTSPRPSLPTKVGTGKEREVLLNISHLPPGVYMVKVNGVYAGKMVKQ